MKSRGWVSHNQLYCWPSLHPLYYSSWCCRAPHHTAIISLQFYISPTHYITSSMPLEWVLSYSILLSTISHFCHLRLLYCSQSFLCTLPPWTCSICWLNTVFGSYNGHYWPLFHPQINLLRLSTVNSLQAFIQLYLWLKSCLTFI
jgi:hypothetical protein